MKIRRILAGCCLCVGVALAMLAGCDKPKPPRGEADGPELKQVLDKLIAAAKARDETGLEACFAKGSVLDLKGFQETKESTNTDELIRRIKLSALTQVLLAKIEDYSIEAENEIKPNVKELDVDCNMLNRQGRAEQGRVRFKFARQSGKWKLSDWEGKSVNK